MMGEEDREVLERFERGEFPSLSGIRACMW
jgi:hypothetical protein